MAEIAVLMPVYIQTAQQLGWLNEAIESLQNQSFKGWELIVVDDASPAFTWSRPANITFLRHDTRRGPGAARNTAAKATRAPWLLAMDADDVLPSDALQTLYNARCEYEITYGDINWIGDRSGYMQLHEYDTSVLRRLAGPMLVTSLHSRKAWRAVGGWSENLEGLEDLDYWIKLAEIGVCGKRLNAVTLHYRKHADSRTAGLMADDMRRMAPIKQEITDKHRPFMGGIMPGCASCPQGTGSPDASLGAAPPGMVELKYTGPMQGGFNTAAGQSGKFYRVDGRGAHLHVNAVDAPFLLSLQGPIGPEYIQVLRQPPPLAPQLFAVQEAEAPIASPGAPSAPPIVIGKTVRELTVIIAEATDIMDLRIWKAEEESTSTPRATVLKAIDKRLTELLGEVA